jgi:hypothetical protein
MGNHESPRRSRFDLGGCTTEEPTQIPAGARRSSAPLSGPVGGRSLGHGVLVCHGVYFPFWCCLSVDCRDFQSVVGLARPTLSFHPVAPEFFARYI